MQTRTALVVILVAALLIAAGFMVRSRGGVISRWIAAHHSAGGH